MKVDFVVHGVSSGVTNAEAIVDGEKITAQVQSLDVELVTVADRHGTLVLRFVGAGIEEAKSLFVRDAVISGTFTAAAAPPRLQAKV